MDGISLKYLDNLAIFYLCLQVVTSANMLSANKYIWHSSLSSDVLQSILHLGAILNLVEFVRHKLDLGTLQDALGLITVWTGRLTKDDDLG